MTAYPISERNAALVAKHLLGSDGEPGGFPMFRAFVRLGFLSVGTLTVTTTEAEAPRFHWIDGGHGSQVRAVAVSPDTQLCASASEDGTLKVWRISDGRLRSTLLTRENEAFAANGVAF